MWRDLGQTARRPGLSSRLCLRRRTRGLHLGDLVSGLWFTEIGKGKDWQVWRKGRHFTLLSLKRVRGFV